MSLNGMPITGEGEMRGEDAAQGPGQSLPSRPERARANNAAAWKPGPIVSPDAHTGRIDMAVSQEESLRG